MTTTMFGLILRCKILPLWGAPLDPERKQHEDSKCRSDAPSDVKPLLLRKVYVCDQLLLQNSSLRVIFTRGFLPPRRASKSGGTQPKAHLRGTPRQNPANPTAECLMFPFGLFGAACLSIPLQYNQRRAKMYNSSRAFPNLGLAEPIHPIHNYLSK